MPIEIRELVIKAMVALDWDNKTVNETQENIVCLRLPSEEQISRYVRDYFMKNESKTLEFDERKLLAFMVEWQSSLLR